MRVETLELNGKGWNPTRGSVDAGAAKLVICYASPAKVREVDTFGGLRARYPNAVIVMSSTGGEILGEEVLDDQAVAAALQFEHSQIKVVETLVNSAADSQHAGKELASQLKGDGLKAVFIVSDGMHVNGTDLVGGMFSVLPADVIVTGGLAGDGANFKQTFVGHNHVPQEKKIVAIGLYGDRLRVGWGSAGGWDAFGPERVITKSEGNVLFELDGKPALELYKSYLGDEAAKLPGSALLFPLSIRPEKDSKKELVRTIVGVDEAKQSLIFAGDVPQGHLAQLMRGHFDHLVEGAAAAAKQAGAVDARGDDALAIMISCIGRKLLMGQRISEEVEAIQSEWGNLPAIGFYSYGEICPHGFTGQCSLHNQTMTITIIKEA